MVNGRLRVIPKDVAGRHPRGRRRRWSLGAHDDQFPVDVFQTGSGTSTNMNVNEVLATPGVGAARRAAVHPNDHVNASQSSNDVFPSAIRLAALRSIVRRLVPALDHLHAGCAASAERSRRHGEGRPDAPDGRRADDVRSGGGGLGPADRAGPQPAASTCCHGWASCRSAGRRSVPGSNAPPRVRPRRDRRSGGRHAGCPLVEAVDHFEAQWRRTRWSTSAVLAKAIALSLNKIAGDLRLLGSGPAAGLAEVALPEPPGRQLDHARQGQPGHSRGGAAGGVPGGRQRRRRHVRRRPSRRSSSTRRCRSWPAICSSRLQLLAAAVPLLADRCLAGLTVEEETVRRYAESSAAVVTALNPVIGYERAAAVAKRAMAERRTVTEIVREERLLDEATIAQVLDPLALTAGGIQTSPARVRPRPASRRRPAGPPAPE